MTAGTLGTPWKPVVGRVCTIPLSGPLLPAGFPAFQVSVGLLQQAAIMAGGNDGQVVSATRQIPPASAT
jgi:hypothetical protein